MWIYNRKLSKKGDTLDVIKVTGLVSLKRKKKIGVRINRIEGVKK